MIRVCTNKGLHLKIITQNYHKLLQSVAIDVATYIHDLVLSIDG